MTEGILDNQYLFLRRPSFNTPSQIEDHVTARHTGVLPILDCHACLVDAFVLATLDSEMHNTYFIVST